MLLVLKRRGCALDPASGLWCVAALLTTLPCSSLCQDASSSIRSQCTRLLRRDRRKRTSVLPEHCFSHFWRVMPSLYARFIQLAHETSARQRRASRVRLHRTSSEPVVVRCSNRTSRVAQTCHWHVQRHVPEREDVCSASTPVHNAAPPATWAPRTNRLFSY
jgi:hypothetical protein